MTTFVLEKGVVVIVDYILLKKQGLPLFLFFSDITTRNRKNSLFPGIHHFPTKEK